MWERLGNVWRSITEPIEKFADQVAPNAKPSLPSPEGVAAIPDTTSKQAIEEASKKGLLPSINAWIYGETEQTTAQKVESLSWEPALPLPSPFARAQQLKLLNTLLESNRIEQKVLEEIKNDDDAHKALVRLFMEQMSTREVHAKFRTEDMQRSRDQLKIVHVTKKMIDEELAFAASWGGMLQTAQKICMVAALGALALSMVVFVSTATAGTGTVPVLSAIAANASYFAAATTFAKSAASVGTAAAQAGSTYLKGRQDKAESAMVGTQHESDKIDHEMKVLQQWMSHVLKHLTHLSDELIQAEEQRHYTLKQKDTQ